MIVQQLYFSQTLLIQYIMQSQQSEYIWLNHTYKTDTSMRMTSWSEFSDTSFDSIERVAN